MGETASAQHVAPAAVVPQTATPRSWFRRPDGRWRYGWILAAVWLVYLVEPLQAALALPDRRLAALGVVDVAAFAACYLVTWSLRRLRMEAGDQPVRHRYAPLAAAGALSLLMCLLTGEHGLASTPFLLVLVMALLPTLAAALVSAVLIGVVGAATAFVPGWDLQPQLLLSLLMVSFVMFGVVQVIERNARLSVENRQSAQLAVANERARFSRDLHDLLGHSLTLMAMKAELAGRLVDLDGERARAEIAEVERLARDALVDVRAAVGGYRRATLAGELVAARAVLDAAGIRAELPAAVDEVPGERRELAGWVVREGVTNVVRHSGAGRCVISVRGDGVRVEDDGRGPGTDGEGNGIAGLRERAATAGARLSVGRSDLGGFSLQVAW